MKNIFLLPTDKPSYLFIIDKSKMFVPEAPYLSYTTVGGRVHKTEGSDIYRPQFIYIINDEKIEDGNWVFQECLNIPHRLIKTDTENVKVLNDLNKCKKIVLTNDTSLIEDGVQSIDDEFLEWFVKNPSCEEVEIESKLTKDGVWTDLKGYVELPTIHSINYKIIIPKEEQKQHIIEMMQNDEELGLYGENIIDTWLEKNGNPEITKQVEKEVGELELEEAAKKYDGKNAASGVKSFIAGAKWQQEQEKITTDDAYNEGFENGKHWQQERSYSEEEVGELLYNVIGEYGKHYSIMIDGKMLNDLFEQFKKK